MATKKPTLNDVPVLLARIADSLEQLTGAPLAVHDPEKPAKVASSDEIATAVSDGVQAAIETKLPELPKTTKLPVAAPTTEAPAVSGHAEETQTVPTTAEPTEEAPTLESLQKTVQAYVRGVEGDPNPPSVEEQNKRMNQVQGLLLKSGKSSLKELDDTELVAFGNGLAELIGGE